jgi:hypothetical protein
LPKGFAILVFLAKEEKNELQQFGKVGWHLWQVDKNDCHARIRSYGSCCSPADTLYDLHLSLSHGPSVTV